MENTEKLKDIETTEKLPLWRKLVYGTGDLGFSMNNSLITAGFETYMLTVVGMDPLLVMIIFLVGRSWDFINDPIIGHLSDRTRSKWGRRRPFLLFGALPFGLSFILLWLKPSGLSSTGLVIYFSVAYIIYEALATAVYMPYFALTPELTEDYDERTKLTSFRMLFNIIGSLTAYMMPFLIFGNWKDASGQTVLTMAIIAAVIAVVPLFAVFLGTKERKEYQSEDRPKLIPSLKRAFKNRPFVFGAMIYLFTWMTIVAVESKLQLFLLYIIQPEQPIIIMASIFVTAIFALPLWNWVSKHWNKRYAYMAGVAFWAIVMLVLIFMNSETPIWVIYFLCVMAGIGVSAAQVLPWSIIPDAIEWEEWKTGERNEGMFYSLITLLGKVGMMIIQPLGLLILKLFGFISTDKSVTELLPQSPSALLGIRLVIGVLPGLLLLAGILMAAFYPLSRDEYHTIVEGLRIRREERKQKRAEKAPLPGVKESA